MKRGIIFAAFLAALGLVNVAQAQEKIESFDVTVNIQENSSIIVSEKIDYDFGVAEKHGIIRDIPVKYKARGGNYNLRISDISVRDENGNNYNFEVSSAGSNKQLKIGDADKFVTGKMTYVIGYRIQRAINYFDTWDELYWNATGNESGVPIEKATAKIILPNNADTNNLQSTCYVGAYGSSLENCDYSISQEDGKTVFLYVSPRMLSAYEGLTIVAGFPKGIVVKPPVYLNLLYTLKDNYILFLPALVFIFMFYLWYTRGRDPKGKGVIIAQYGPPDNLSPAEVGTIMDADVDKVDISAEIINLAVQGYIKINKIKKEGIFHDSDDYQLEKLKGEEDLPEEFQRKLMNRIFRGKLQMKISELKQVFYQDMEKIKNLTYSSILEKKYYEKNPNNVRGVYVAIGIFLAISSFATPVLFGAFGFWSVLAAGFIVIAFGIIMPARTIKGSMARENILGLKEYLSVAEKERIKFHNAPAKNPEHFEKLLPYAMVLGVEKEWAGQFADIYKEENPSWYSDYSGGRFNSALLVSNLNSFAVSANTSLTSMPAPASSGGSGFSGGGGGGFSGGGFGGGGVGSW